MLGTSYRSGTRGAAWRMPGAPALARAARGCTGFRPRHAFACSRGRGVASAPVPACAAAHGIGHDAAALPSSPGGSVPLHYAVVGAGLAGLAAAWQLLKRTPRGRPVHLHLYDAAGIAAGGSGAAAGLLHPYSPRGKLLWRGQEAMDEALQLVAAAEAAHAAAEAGPSAQQLAGAGGGGPFVWRDGLVRSAATIKQSADFAKAGQAAAAAAAAARQAPVTQKPEVGSSVGGSGGSSSTRIRVLSAAELEALVPGLQAPAHVSAGAASTTTPPEPGAEGPLAATAGMNGVGGNRRARRAAAAAATTTVDAAGNAGLLIEAGLVLDVGRYLRGLWLACQAEATARGDGSTAQLRLQRVTSLEQMRPCPTATGLESGADSRYDVVVVAAGAAAATILEVAALSLPLQLCQGLTLVMSPPAGGGDDAAGRDGAVPSGGYPAGAPSLLGQPYLAAQGRRQLVVGATKAYGWSPDQALAACCRSEYAAAREGDTPAVTGEATTGPAEQEAVEVLRAAACGVWRPLSAWQIDRVREGVRALPPRTQHGSLPLLGRVAPSSSWWLVAGLGSRGLVYHGWLGRLVAEAAVAVFEAP
ncbi:hypothetical protein HXX76_006587 [Chlamydomonas incerta]|uniref:FAD dependent oxidoreductase domain-containing protein n=1 Tax=Chlamydomonas incerta TaxID=51695 RepID=A0A835T2R4_CHLIN|nr:hypothetical protein HXX76_006587 [Chlamydomonas incerta]|eukprot:KAG2436276.1 hypothetical protein HXX76_006587 [Chlamydomonas incerta]